MSVEQLIPVVITGPSGAGKGTLIDRLKKEFEGSFGFCVSHTTRKPREGEVDGVHYYFTDKASIEKEIAEDKFVESANVHGNYYGTSKKALQNVLDKGKICILDIDVQGCESVKKAKIPAKFIFISPPSYEELEKRLRGRGTESEESLQKRLTNARTEMGYLDKPGFFDIVIVNDNLEDSYTKLRDIILPYIHFQKSLVRSE
ncbi:guanylate kinase [Cavenderia fasciculata]|uniref:guanylate kinase n=1 Tax=Cavenderia fasciculata TaxID=261658 RepID=F4PQW6_CACFS|nr:guanylate kinase [Cavenderia fasciculata]EGG21231.1 guanylate kinase [Cavenderia fasciculata]|eukprot:XP_004359081.1 guanylate kinase [Cavenderia fasciculata]